MALYLTISAESSCLAQETLKAQILDAALLKPIM